LTIAATYQSLLATLYDLRMDNRRWRQYSNLLIQENNWRAQRYGVDQSLIDFGRGALSPMAVLAEELIEIVQVEASAIGALDHVERLRTIVANGTSADRQRRVYNDAIAGGAEVRDALNAVVDHLVAETVEGL
jgi:carboxylate-amine ligase